MSGRTIFLINLPSMVYMSSTLMACVAFTRMVLAAGLGYTTNRPSSLATAPPANITVTGIMSHVHFDKNFFIAVSLCAPSVGQLADRRRTFVLSDQINGALLFSGRSIHQLQLAYIDVHA